LAIIDGLAFANCEKLLSIEISRSFSLKKIGPSVLRGCSALKSLFLPNGSKALPGSAFCGSGIETVTIDDGNEFLTVSEGFSRSKSMSVAIRCLIRAIQIAILASIEILGKFCSPHCKWISEVAFAK
jgi:hypothetical protein